MSEISNTSTDAAEIQRAAELVTRNITETLNILRTSGRNYQQCRELWQGAGFDVDDLPMADLDELLAAVERVLEQGVPVPVPPQKTTGGFSPSGEAA